MTAISEKRWQEAQRYEAEYWAKEATNRAKLMADLYDGYLLTCGVLGIYDEGFGAPSVLDIAGGPYPLSYFMEPMPHYTVLDPGDYPSVGYEKRISAKAEGWRGGMFGEVWGYNVLQHVVDPAEVMATARACATRTIRWFDVVETPVYPVHPHSIKADWLRAELSRDGFKIVRDIDGSRLLAEGVRQKWVALVAERT